MKKRSGPAFAGGLAALLLLLPLYVLSIGPAVWLFEHGYVAYEPLEALYGPLEWLAQRTPLHGPLVWYVEFFVDR